MKAVSPSTGAALYLFAKLLRAERRVAAQELEYQEVMERVPEAELSAFLEQTTEMADASEEAKYAHKRRWERSRRRAKR